jgi:hypothetical protein
MTPPILIRTVRRQALARRSAIAICLGLGVVNLGIFIALGSESESHAVVFIMGLVSFWILRKKRFFRDNNSPKQEIVNEDVMPSQQSTESNVPSQIPSPTENNTSQTPKRISTPRLKKYAAFGAFALSIIGVSIFGVVEYLGYQKELLYKSKQKEIQLLMEETHSRLDRLISEGDLLNRYVKITGFYWQAVIELKDEFPKILKDDPVHGFYFNMVDTLGHNYSLKFGDKLLDRFLQLAASDGFNQREAIQIFKVIGKDKLLGKQPCSKEDNKYCGVFNDLFRNGWWAGLSEGAWNTNWLLPEELSEAFSFHFRHEQHLRRNARAPICQHQKIVSLNPKINWCKSSMALFRRNNRFAPF